MRMKALRRPGQLFESIHLDSGEFLREIRTETIDRKGENMPGETGRRRLTSFRDLDVYGMSFHAAMEIYDLTKEFPIEERYSLTDQIRRSSRSVCANVSEAWHRRRYPASFVSKLTDSLGEAAETQTWIHFAVACRYLSPNTADRLEQEYCFIIGKLVRMISAPEKWHL